MHPGDTMFALPIPSRPKTHTEWSAHTPPSPLRADTRPTDANGVSHSFSFRRERYGDPATRGFPITRGTGAWRYGTTNAAPRLFAEALRGAPPRARQHPPEASRPLYRADYDDSLFEWICAEPYRPAPNRRPGQAVPETPSAPIYSGLRQPA